MAIDTTTSVDVQTLTPFKKFIMTIGALPTSYLESMTYAELLMWFCNYLQNTVIPTVNNNAEAVEELQGLYEELKTYVNDYFDNLDVQEEIDNKLDDMAKDGTLTNLINDVVVSEIQPQIDTQNASILNIQNTVTSIASGSPAGVYDTLSDLQTDDPNHNRIYLVTANGHWYYYDTGDSAWTDGGLYQSSGLSDGSVRFKNIGGQLNTDILRLSDYEEIESTVTSGAFINKHTHAPENYSAYSYFTADITDYDYLKLSYVQTGDANPISYAFYDGMDTYISQVQSAVGTYEDSVVTIPNGATTIKVNSANANISKTKIKALKFFNKKGSIKDFTIENGDALTDLSNYMSYNTYTNYTIEDGFVNYYTHQLNTTYSGYYHVTIPVNLGDKFKYTTNASGDMAAVVFWDENETYISQSAKSPGSVSNVSLEIDNPNVKYITFNIAFSKNNFALQKYQLNFQQTSKDIYDTIALNAGIKNDLGSLTKGAVIFIVDDGMNTDATYIYPLIDEFDIPFVFALWSTSEVMTNHLNTLKGYITNNGCEVAQHFTSPRTGLSIISSYQEMLQQKQAFASNDIVVTNHVYAYNQTDTNLMISSSGMYDYCVGGGYKINRPKTNRYNLTRYMINTDTSLSTYQGFIDTAKDENRLLIFGIHSSELANSDLLAKYRGIISYAISSGIEITTLNQIDSL